MKRSFKSYQSEHDSVRSPLVFHFTCILSYTDVQCTLTYKYKERGQSRRGGGGGTNFERLKGDVWPARVCFSGFLS